MADQLTLEQIAKFKEVFSRFENGDGIITTNDLVAVMRALGENPTDEELKDMTKDINTVENDIIEFPAFLAMMARKLEDNEIEEEIREAFRYFDEESTGLIASTQLRSIIETAVEHITIENITDEEIDAIIGDTDANRSGQINYEDFINSFFEN